MNALILDRMELDEVGANPQRLADAIHQQLGDRAGPVPVYDVARALDILEIREEPLISFEGALVTTPERDRGSILLNANSNRQRRRFTLGHELGHFLNSWHRPTSASGFWCSRRDMTAGDLHSTDRYSRQEAEANRFAIELLTPRKRLRRYLIRRPDLSQVLAMADEFNISREAAARRFVSLHHDSIAVVFSKDGKLRYAEQSETFPSFCLSKGMSLPPLDQHAGSTELSDPEETPADHWLSRPRGVELTAQTLQQRDGMAMILLRVTAEDEEPDDLEDTFDRFSGLGPR